MNQSQPNQSPPQPKKPGSNTALIIIIVVIAALVVLGAGGYFAWRYLAKKISTAASTQTTPTPSPTVSQSPSATISPTATPQAASSSALKTGTMPVNGYIISDSNTRVISESELFGLTPWQLKVARNEIYARHGRPFVHKDLQCYFANQAWYHGNPNYSETLLTAIENKNVATIQSYEQKTNSPLQNYDTGC